mgnify:CR=1 FL=1
MARFDTSFDATSVEPTTAHELLPAGKYRAQIVESEMRVTKNGMGQFLWLMLDIIEGPYQGRKLFDQLNLVNSNPQTVEIAQRTLSAICHATGKLQVNDSVDLHLVPVTIQGGVKPPKDGYSEKNTIRYLVPERTAPAAPAYQAAPAASQPPAAPAAAPWNRNG